MSSPNDDAAGRMKDAGRNSRLSFRNFAEHQLRNEFKEEAMEKCHVQVKAFAECASEEGILVVFRCREFQSAINECLSVYASNERWELYKKENAEDLANRIITNDKK